MSFVDYIVIFKCITNDLKSLLPVLILETRVNLLSVTKIVFDIQAIFSSYLPFLLYNLGLDCDLTWWYGWCSLMCCVFVCMSYVLYINLEGINHPYWFLRSIGRILTSYQTWAILGVFSKAI